MPRQACFHDSSGQRKAGSAGQEMLLGEEKACLAAECQVSFGLQGVLWSCGVPAGAASAEHREASPSA